MAWLESPEGEQWSRDKHYNIEHGCQRWLMTLKDYDDDYESSSDIFEFLWVA